MEMSSKKNKIVISRNNMRYTKIMKNGEHLQIPWSYDLI